MRVHRLNKLIRLSLTLALLLAALSQPFMRAQGTVMPYARIALYDGNGNPCNGCLLDTWAAGTTTAQATYTDSALSVANANPVVLDSAGRATVFLSATSYRFRLRSAAGSTIWDVDNVAAVPTTGGNVDVTGTAGEAVTAGQVIYLSDGSGALTAGRWYRADADFAYASTTPQVGIAPTAIASGASGTIRLVGRVTGLSGLTAGTIYYASATAGALTATAPSNSRSVGQADTTTSLIVGPQPSTPTVALAIAEGRLTATSGTPVTTADVTAATSLFYAPYKGNRIQLYDGTNWNVRTFTEITISVVGCTASRPYDVFLSDVATVVTATTLVWTSATARATALVEQNGVLSRSGTLTQRYIGTFYCNSTGGQTDDSFARRYVWNYYNRVPRLCRVIDTTDTWTYATDTYRQANGAAGNQLDVVVGVAEVLLDARVFVVAYGSAASLDIRLAIGEDSTTTPHVDTIGRLARTTGATEQMQVRAELSVSPPVGRHVYVWLERASGATVTFYGDGAAGINAIMSGMSGVIEG